MMTFGEFVSACGEPMEWLSAEARKVTAIPNLGSFSKSHIFYLESEEKASQLFSEIKSDLGQDMKESLKLPFPDISIVERTGSPIAIGGERGEDPGWFCDRLIQMPSRSGIQHFLWFRVFTVKDQIQLTGDTFAFLGAVQPEGNPDWMVKVGLAEPGQPSWPLTVALRKQFAEVSREPAMKRDILTNIANICFEIAMISHPMNYIIKVTPALTPQEEKRAKKFGKPPSYKRPHFIVLDHEVLVSMRKPGDGTHASPVPHHRRGHWARLAEHCRHAKLLGRERVWKRPTFVGDRKFSDSNNLYEVLLEISELKA